MYIITAKSGVGKTTLLRIIAGLDTDFHGEVTGGGPTNVSYAFQEYRLFDSLNALRNICEISFKEKNTENQFEAVQMLLRFGFTKEETHLFPRALSGGMKQRVSLARAFLKKSPILLLDEPDKELDESLLSTLYTLISEEAEKRLVLLVTHRDLTQIFPDATYLNL